MRTDWDCEFLSLVPCREEIQTSIKIDDSLSRLWGEGGQRDSGRGGRVRGQQTNGAPVPSIQFLLPFRSRLPSSVNPQPLIGVLTHQLLQNLITPGCVGQNVLLLVAGLH